jgi:ACS family D-galactonate transporter-like MFS transporter
MTDRRPGGGTESLATQPPAAIRRLQGRHVVLGLMFVGMIISYIDRTNISVVGPTLAKELNIGPAGLGLIFSAFAWTYAIGNPPGGFLVDRYGTRRTLGIALLAWSTVTVGAGGGRRVHVVHGAAAGAWCRRGSGRALL